MDLGSHLGAHPEWFAPLYLLAFLSAYVASAVAGYRRGWPPAAWLLVLAAAGIGGVVGTRLLPLGVDGLAALLTDGVLPEAGTRRLPGTILGALAAAELARRALGVRLSMLDPLVTGGLVGLVVARLGCLAAGCCFGTPTDLPWGVVYADGSVVHGFHLAHGLAEAGHAASVHPVPLYDVLFGVVGLALLPVLRRRLRAAGSLCGVAVAAYALHRVVQEAVRADAVAWAGGLTQMQVGMAVVGVLALVAVVVAERRGGGEAGPSAEPSGLRLVALLAAAVGVWAGLGGWLTPGESAVLLVRLVPAAVAVGFVVRRSAAAPRLRWATAGLAAALPLAVGFQAEAAAEPFTLLAAEGHAATGRYEDAQGCSTAFYDYQKAGGTLAVVRVDPAEARTWEYGVRVLHASETQVDDQRGRVGQAGWSVAPYVRREGPGFGASLGLLAGDLTTQEGPDAPAVVPTFDVRLGPRRSHLQFGFADQGVFGLPAGAAHLGAGTGWLTASGQEVRIEGGLLDNGLYVSGTLPAGPHVLIAPMGAWTPGRSGDRTSYQIGARVRVQIPVD